MKDEMHDYLAALLADCSTRDALDKLGYSSTSFGSLRRLCQNYGVDIPPRTNQHSTMPLSLHQMPQEARKHRMATPATPYPREKTLNRAVCGIAVFDLHHPHETKKLWANILRFAADFGPDVFVFGGDNMNIDALDHWALDGNKRRKIEGKRLVSEYASFNTDVFDPLEAILSPECRRIFHFGNHEDWVEQYIDLHPEVEGFFEITRNIQLEGYGWEVYPYGLTSNVGKLYFHHGEYTVKHNAAKTVEVYQRNMVYGHGHTYQAHTNITPIDSEAHTAVQIPCACDLNPHYRINKPNAWLNGFAVFYVQPDGSFNLYPVISIGGEFTAPTGVRYE